MHLNRVSDSRLEREVRVPKASKEWSNSYIFEHIAYSTISISTITAVAYQQLPEVIILISITIQHNKPSMRPGNVN